MSFLRVEKELFHRVLDEIKTRKSFLSLEHAYERIARNSEGYQTLLHLPAEQPEIGRSLTQTLDVSYQRESGRKLRTLAPRYIGIPAAR
jgi:hypothetical protein